MNSFNGHITNIEVKDLLSIITIKLSEEIEFNAIVVETNDSTDYLLINKKVKVLFKETEVIIGKGNELNVSIQNRITGIVSKIEEGVLLSKVLINTPIGDISAIISTRAVIQLNLINNDKVIAMVKLNEVTLSML